MIIYEIEKDIEGTIHEDILMNRLDQCIKPVYNNFFGLEYHASVTLYDNTFLPCVVFRHLGKAIELKFNSLHAKVYHGTIQRTLLHQDDVQKDIIERIISQNNIIDLSDIVKIETCVYSFPEKLRKIKFNPTHYFLVRFDDGSFENFRGSETGFYEVPFGKEFENIVEIFSSTLMLQNGDIIELKNYMDWKNNEANFKKIHFGKPFFTCYFGGSHEKDFEEKLAKTRINFRE
ncbi:hypothetical protein SAMN05443633_102411 [Chryseobacterium arachidis]|uniref:Uncharacterized protein n=1 Tax=Chryseobacterium arachidis TaxID=1416778 RepID=A0A1M4XT37_9FLAO|nr:hypothetical protein [Chryseobacterium arachidis]SHE96412.1 hypothetical protein SAMN05443633_102411 [Chryseobacterium arachidis]